MALCAMGWELDKPESYGLRVAIEDLFAERDEVFRRIEGGEDIRVVLCTSSTALLQLLVPQSIPED